MTLNSIYMDTNPNVVKEELTTPEASQATVTTTPEEVVKSGDKTDPNLLLKSLQEEREKRKQLESKLEELNSSALSEEQQSDEGKAILAEVRQLKSDLAAVKQDSVKKDLQMSNPILKDKWDEFESFRNDPENQGMNLKTAAKAFLIEIGEAQPVRKGVEKTTGGSRTPASTGMTIEDAKHLRETNPRLWKEMASKGQLNIQA